MLFIPEGEHSNSGSPGENKNNKKGKGIGPRIIRPALTSKENDNNNVRFLDSKQKNTITYGSNSTSSPAKIKDARDVITGLSEKKIFPENCVQRKNYEPNGPELNNWNRHTEQTGDNRRKWTMPQTDATKTTDHKHNTNRTIKNH